MSAEKTMQEAPDFLLPITDILSARYYRLALAAAARHDLGAAWSYARFALMIDAQNMKAVALMELCAYEMGEYREIQELFATERSLFDVAIDEEKSLIDDLLVQVRVFVQQKKWRKAILALQAIPHQSVRILNIMGCLFALSGRFGTASEYFAKALALDCGNRLAMAGFADSVKRRKRFWID